MGEIPTSAGLPYPPPDLPHEGGGEDGFTMRLTAEIWVKAYVRGCQVGGAQAFVVRHGDDDAGAIFVRINKLDGTSLLFGPAAAGLSGQSEERSFEAKTKPGGAPDEEIETRLLREREFDGDLWIVEVEDRQGRHFLDGWLARET